MESQEYTSQEAYELLMDKLFNRDAGLARIVQDIVDMGIDEVVEKLQDDRRKKPIIYIQTRAMKYEEALQTAVHVLHTFFVDQPTIVRSINEEFERYIDGDVSIELKTESKLTVGVLDVLPLRVADIESIDAQRRNIVNVDSLFRLAR